MEKKINEDLSRITKFVNNMTKDVKNNKKVNLKDNKLKKLQKELNIHKVKLIANKKRTQSGGTDEKMIQELVQYATKIDIFSSKLENVIGNLSTISESIGDLPIRLKKSTFEQVIKNSRANSLSNKAVNINTPNNNTVKTKNNSQKGGNSDMIRQNTDMIGQLNMNYIQSIVYMSEVVKYISQWINTVNTIITNNQLGLSDKCLEKSREMMESLAKLAQSQQKTDVVVPQGSLVRQ